MKSYQDLLDIALKSKAKLRILESDLYNGVLLFKDWHETDTQFQIRLACEGIEADFELCDFYDETKSMFKIAKSEFYDLHQDRKVVWHYDGR